MDMCNATFSFRTKEWHNLQTALLNMLNKLPVIENIHDTTHNITGINTHYSMTTKASSSSSFFVVETIGTEVEFGL